MTYYVSNGTLNFAHSLTHFERDFQTERGVAHQPLLVSEN